MDEEFNLKEEDIEFILDECLYEFKPILVREIKKIHEKDLESEKKS